MSRHALAPSRLFPPGAAAEAAAAASIDTPVALGSSAGDSKDCCGRAAIGWPAADSPAV